MEQPNKIKQYTTLLCEQVRWKRAHDVISEEIEHHLIDQKDAFMADGMDEVTSTDQAIKEMGDPVTIGVLLDRTHRPKTEWSMVLLTILLLLIRLVINYFIKNLQLSHLPESYYFYNAIAASVVGMIFLIITYYIDFTIIGKHPFFIFALFMTTLICAIPLSKELNGAIHWIIPVIGDVFPSVFLLFFPTIYTGVISSMRSKGYIGILLCGFFYAIPAFIYLLTVGSITGILLYTITCFSLLVMSIYKNWFSVKRLYGMLLVLIPTAISVIMIFVRFIQTVEFQIMINPYSHPSGYQARVIRDLLNGAKLFGQGTLPPQYNGDVTGWLPGFDTEFIMTYLIHRVGWFSFLIIALVLIIFIVRGFYLCNKQKSVLGRLVSTSILLTLTFQVVVCLIMNLGISMYTDLTLPFIASGGMTIIANLGLVGILLSVFRTGYLHRYSHNVVEHKINKRFELVNGKLIINLGFKVER